MTNFNRLETTRIWCAFIIVVAAAASLSAMELVRATSDSAQTRPDSASDSTTARASFFDPSQFESPTCKAETPLFSIGSIGVGVFPYPAYSEEFGWNLGLVVSASKHKDGSDPSSVLALLPSYAEREDRGSLVVTGRVNAFRSEQIACQWGASIWLYPEMSSTTTSARIQVETSDARQVGAALIEFSNAEYHRIRDLSEADRSTGICHQLAIACDVYGFGPERSLLKNVWVYADGSVSGGALGGDYSYRQALVRVDWPTRFLGLWMRWGATHGDPPVQDLFDVGRDGGIVGIPLRRMRSHSLLAAGAEARVPLGIGVTPASFFSAANAPDGFDNPLEIGLALILDDESAVANRDTWTCRIELPFYTRGASSVSARDDWDWRRFMIRINFPLLGSELSQRNDIIRYRYPNR